MITFSAKIVLIGLVALLVGCSGSAPQKGAAKKVAPKKTATAANSARKKAPPSSAEGSGTPFLPALPAETTEEKGTPSIAPKTTAPKTATPVSPPTGQEELLQKLRRVTGMSLTADDSGHWTASMNATDFPIWDDLAQLKNLRVIKMEGVKNDEPLANISKCTQIEELDCGFFPQMTGKGLAHLASLVNLKKFRLKDAKLEQGDFSFLAKLPLLEEVNLNSTPLGDEGIVHLAGAKKMRQLDLTDTQLTDAGVVHLAELTELDVLLLGSNKFTIKGLGHLRKLTKLTELILPSFFVNEVGWYLELTTLVNLKKIEPDMMYGLDDVKLEKLTFLSHAEKLNLGLSDATDSGIAASMPKFSAAKRLDLRIDGKNQTDVCLTFLARLSQVETLKLDVRGSKIQGTGLKNLSGCEQLAKLTLSFEHLDRGLEHLASLPKLEELWLFSTISMDQELSLFPDLPQLKSLKLSFAVTDEGLKHVGRLKNLKELEVSGTITGKGPPHLAGLTKLEVLELGVNKELSGGFLADLKGLQDLQTLGLFGAQMTDDDITAVKQFPKLSNLNLSNTLISDKSVPLLKGLKGLKHLYIHKTMISEKGGDEIKAALPDTHLER
jgi:internalin A